MDTPVTFRNAPKIAVIVPAYNQAQYLTKAIQSVLEQTLPDFELIVVDDGSTDETPQLLDGIRDNRLRVIHQSNAGLPSARNTGLQKSSASLVTFLDSDDYFLPDKLEILSMCLEEHPEIGLVAGKAKYIDHAGNAMVRPESPPVPLSMHALLLENPICVSGIMLRREWLKRVGVFDETLRACEDWDLWLRLLAAGCPMAWVDHPVVAYRIHPGQMTGQAQRMQKAIFTVLDKFFAEQRLPDEIVACKNDAYASAMVHSAAFAYLSGEYEVGSSNLAEAIRLSPAFKDNRYKKLLGLLVGWSYDPRSSDPAAFLQRIIANPPSGHIGFGIQLRRALADVILGSLFKSSMETWRARRLDLLRAVLYKPRWLFNRGVLRMLADAWLH